MRVDVCEGTSARVALDVYVAVSAGERVCVGVSVRLGVGVCMLADVAMDDLMKVPEETDGQLY